MYILETVIALLNERNNIYTKPGLINVNYVTRHVSQIITTSGTASSTGVGKLLSSLKN